MKCPKDKFLVHVFTIQINDLKEEADCKVSQFTRQHKIAERTCSNGNIWIFRQDVDKLNEGTNGV